MRNEGGQTLTCSVSVPRTGERTDPSIAQAVGREVINSLSQAVHPGGNPSCSVLRRNQWYAGTLCVAPRVHHSHSAVSDRGSAPPECMEGGVLQCERNTPENDCSHHFKSSLPAPPRSLISVFTELATKGGSPLSWRGAARRPRPRTPTQPAKPAKSGSLPSS